MGNIGADDLTDSVGTDLADADSVVIGEPGIPTGWLAGAVTDVYRWLSKPDDRTLAQQFNALVGLDENAPLGVTVIDLLSMAPFLGQYIQTANQQDTLSRISDIYDEVLVDSNRLAVLRALLEALTPVSLPVDPPAGYGAPSVSDIWDEQRAFSDMYSTNGLGLNAWVMAQSINAFGALVGGQAGYLDSRSPYFSLIASGPDTAMYERGPWAFRAASRTVPPATPTWSAWNGVSTLVAFLNAQCPTHVWSTTSPDGVATPGFAWAPDPDESNVWWRCNVQEWQLPFVSGRLASMLTYQAVPAWPGIDNVSLGEPIALADSGVYESECDGFILSLSSVESGIQYTQVGDYKLYSKLGRYSFLSDAPSTEVWQGIPSNNCILMPSRLLHTTGVVLHFYRGVTGTVTPFTINT